METIDLLTVKRIILNDPSLSPLEKARLCGDADHAWTSNPSGVQVNDLAVMGFGALAGYLWSHLTGAGTMGTIANSLIGGWAAHSMFGSSQNDTSARWHQGYFTY